MSRATHGEYDFEDLGSAHGRLPPWSEDRTTAHYRNSGNTESVLFPLPRAAERTSAVPPVRDARAAQRPLGNAYYQVPRAVPNNNWQPAPSDEVEEHAFVRPKPLANLIALGAASLSLFAAAFVLRTLMLAMTVPPPAAAPQPAPVIAQPAPPPTAAPPAAAPVHEESPQPAAAPEQAAAPRPHEVDKHKPPVVHATRARMPAPPAPAAEPEPEPEPIAAPAEPAQNAAPGTLRVNSLPWAHVFLDGRLIGNTPLRGVAVAAGTHSLRLVNPQFSLVKTVEITLEPGRVLTVAEVLEE